MNEPQFRLTEPAAAPVLAKRLRTIARGMRAAVDKGGARPVLLADVLDLEDAADVLDTIEGVRRMTEPQAWKIEKIERNDDGSYDVALQFDRPCIIRLLDDVELAAAGITPPEPDIDGSWSRPSRQRDDVSPTSEKVRWAAAADRGDTNEEAT